ncbi:MAG: sensor histidine kinase, partial [Myxococcota bacterium]
MHAGQSASFPAIPDRNRLNFLWLMKLRWAEIIGQTATVLGVEWWLGIDVPLMPLLAIIAIELASNLLCVAWFRGQPQVAEGHLAAVMALDVALLTALLYFTGGPDNPFSFLYLVQIALAAVVLHAYWTWMLVGLSLGSFGLLLIAHRDLPALAI